MNHRRSLFRTNYVFWLMGTWLVILLSFPSPPSAAETVKSGRSTLGVVNINTASFETLQLLPGVGPVIARAILDQRKSLGGFERLEELAEVRGIGPAMLKGLRSHVILVGRTTARLDSVRSYNRRSVGP